MPIAPRIIALDDIEHLPARAIQTRPELEQRAREDPDLAALSR